MNLHEALSIVRPIVHDAATRLAPGRWQPSGESVLLRSGRCWSVRFRFIGLRAEWLVDFGTIKFFNVEGHLLKTVLIEGGPAAAAA